MGRGYLAVLTIFTILEFFIAVIAAHFGCQATRAQADAVSSSTPAWASEEGGGWEGSLPPAPPCFPLCWKMGLFSSWPQRGASTNGPAALCALMQSRQGMRRGFAHR